LRWRSWSAGSGRRSLDAVPSDDRLPAHVIRAVEDELASRGARIVAASIDSFWSHKAWFESNPLQAGVRYSILADTSQLTARPCCLIPDHLVRPATIGDREVAHSTTETLRLLGR